MSRARWLIQRLLPAAVSIAALTALLAIVDFSALIEALSWKVALVLVPALLVYGAATLTLEAASLTRLLEFAASRLSAWTAARIKCASYLLGIVHYALGVAALSVLLQRRAGIRLAESASVVLLISAVDLLVVLVLATTGAAVSEIEAPAVLAGVLALLGAGFVSGLMLVRTPASLGPLERIRSLSFFAALRTTSWRRLGELALLRVTFAACFIALGALAFRAFGLAPPLSGLIVGMLVVGVVAALPIAIAGLGTGNAAFVLVFRDVADAETLLALSLVLSAGMISLRVAMGLIFAREFTREALQQSRKEAA
jgi:hypothetical protein